MFNQDSFDTKPVRYRYAYAGDETEYIQLHNNYSSRNHTHSSAYHQINIASIFPVMLSKTINCFTNFYHFDHTLD